MIYHPVLLPTLSQKGYVDLIFRPKMRQHGHQTKGVSLENLKKNNADTPDSSRPAGGGAADAFQIFVFFF